MGGCNSCCIPHKNPNLCRENHAKTPKLKGHSRSLSATFVVKDHHEELQIEQLNINSATEEELMTLPGINRQTSHNIVQYRQQIGGFKKVEDLALVSGVGATKLSQIRLEITCVNRKSSRTSTPLGSKQEVRGVADLEMVGRAVTRSQRSSSKVNINTSNVFQLMKVNGIDQNLAENIVAHRDRKGAFKSIDDLTKVRGINYAILSAIRHSLTLDMTGLAHPPSSTNLNGTIPHSRSTPKMSLCESGDSIPLELKNIPGPWSIKNQRPDVIPFSFRRNKRPAIRIASWNLERCSDEKMDNIGVREVVCMTIMENGISLVAFQELASKKVLDKLCDELNNPTLPLVQRWKGHRGTWKSVTSPAAGRMFQATEYNGFLYDTNMGVEYMDSKLLDDVKKGKNKTFVRKPFIGIFKVNRFDFVMVSVHLKATGLRNQDLDDLQEEISNIDEVVEAVEKQLPGENDLLFVGDFNLAPEAKDFDVLRNKNFNNVIHEGQFTNISSKNPEGSKSYDNIWISPQSFKAHTGNSGVVRKGLTSPWIPDGWSWGGVASDHCPVWAEFYTGKDYDRGDINIGLGGITINAK